MPFDGSGNYVPPSAPTFPAVTGTTITAAYFNATINDIASAISLCLTRDNQGKPSADQNWNGKSLSNVNAIGAASGTFTGALVAASLAISGNGTIGGTLGVTGALTAASLVLGTALGTQYGGTGVDGHLAANGTLLIGNGAGFSLANLTAGANITITNAGGSITIAATGSGGGGSTSFNLSVANDGSGTVAPFTFNGSAAKTISWNSVGARPDTPRIQTVASAATVTPTFANDMVLVTAQAAGLTLANPTGTAIDGWGIVIRIKDNGTARTIAFGTQYRAIGVTLPTTTVANKTLYIGMVYNAADTKWDVLAVQQEA